MARPSVQTGLDPRDIFAHAGFYHKTSTLLSSEIVKDMPRQAHTEFVFPQVVMSAFASEIYLKCLHAIEFQGTVPKDHPFDKLFGGLPVGTKQVVKKHWNAMAAHNPIFKTGSARPGKRPKNDLVSALREGGLAFMKYRCAYEGKQLKGYSLASLPDVLRDAILELKPEWRASSVL
jgi:hypothetical protein